MTDRPTDPTVLLRPAAPESVDGHRPTAPTDRNADPTTVTDRPTDQTEPTMPTDPTTVTPTDPTRPATDPTGATDTDQTSRHQPTRRDQPTAIDPTVIDRANAIREHTTDQTDRPVTDADIAPIPQRMRWIGIWLDRTFGAMPLLAPLVVSGYFTMQVFQDAPINAWPLVAFFATLALEGGVWKLSRLYEKTLVAGDSTIALRLGITLYLALISGLIYWHAANKQAQLAGTGLNVDTLTALGTGDTFPAFGTAVMSALGVFIWSRTARWQRRRELHAAGRIDMQMPKFSPGAWLLTPIETPQALRHAVKFRIESPKLALDDLRLYKAAGRPALWPPTRPTTDPTAVAPTITDPTDQTAGAEQTTATPTDPTAVATTITDQTRPVVHPTTDQATTPTDRADRTRPATDPTAIASTTRPTAPTRPTPAAPTIKPTRPASTAPTGGNTDRPAFSPAAIGNAAYIREQYGTNPDLRLATVRADLGWSFDRANPAHKAYLAGADQPTDQEPAADMRQLAHAN